jgi:anti-sigma factor RsiW
MGIDPRECAEVRELFGEYVEDGLNADQRGRVDRHLGRCHRCRRVLANLHRTIDHLAHLRDAKPADPEIADRIQRSFRARRYEDPRT